MTEPFEVGQRVHVTASAMRRLLQREPAEGELYRTVRTLHPEHPDKWVMLDWPFFWFNATDVTVLHDNPPRPRQPGDPIGAVRHERDKDTSRPLFSHPGNPDQGILADNIREDMDALVLSRLSPHEGSP